MSYERLASTPEGARSLSRASLRSRMLGVLHRAVEESGVSQTELARRLGVRKSAVHRTLNGNGNLRVDTIADMLSALGYELHVSACDAGEILAAMGESRAPECHAWLPGQASSVASRSEGPRPHEAMHKATFTVEAISMDGAFEDEVTMFSVTDPRHHLEGPRALFVTAPGESAAVSWTRPVERDFDSGRVVEASPNARSFSRVVG